MEKLIFKATAKGYAVELTPEEIKEKEELEKKKELENQKVKQEEVKE